MAIEANLITVGDIHAADRAPGSRRDDYRAAVRSKLENIREEASIHKADAVLLTGDVFHRKEPVKNSHGLVRELIETFRSFPCPVYAAPGNHDMTNDRLDSIPKQPLGVLFQSGAVTQLDPEGHILTKGDLKVKIAATSYNEIDPLPECHKVKLGSADVLVTVGHFYATPKGGPFFNHVAVSYDQLAGTETHIWVLGHFHMDQGVERIEDTWFINIGSLTRGALDEDNLTRQIKVGHIQIHKPGPAATWSAREIPLRMAPADDIFDLKKHREKQAEKAAVEAFVHSLGAEFSQLSDTAADPKSILESLYIPDRIRRETLRRIEVAGGG